MALKCHLGPLSGLGTIDEDVFSPMSNLRYLDLTNCSIADLPLTIFDNLTRLTELRLAKNPLTQAI